MPTVQALIRWDPAWYAARELAERRELGFPPAARIASLTGVPEAVADLLAAARLHEAAGVRTARKAAQAVRIQVDPLDLL